MPKRSLGLAKRPRYSPLKVMVVAGARPNFMKLASIVDAINESNSQLNRPIDLLIVHTGQHYDANMSDTFFHDLNLPAPHIQLGVGSGTHASQTAEIMKRFEPVLLQYCPDILLVVGDVNSTVACTLVGAKITYPPIGHGKDGRGRRRPILGHVEAGLRSGDRSMPEEINRILTDALSDLLFVTENTAKRNLRLEGIPSQHIFFVGNTMVDTLLKHRAGAQQAPFISRMERFQRSKLLTSGKQNSRGGSSRVPYGVVTLHRPSNVDQETVFKGIMKALKRISRRLPLLFSIHPRTMNQLKAFGLDKHVSFEYFSNQQPISPKAGIFLLPPLSYLDCLGLVSQSKVVLTDSGGLQEETTALGVPCVTIRNNTERPITITQGSNVLAGTDPTAIERLTIRQLKAQRACRKPPYWDGLAGKRIVKVLLKQSKE